MAQKLKFKCVVGCADSDGIPDLVPVIIECTKDEYDNGEHYDAAKNYAEDKNYESPDFAFDENDNAFRFISNINWDETPVITL